VPPYTPSKDTCVPDDLSESSCRQLPPPSPTTTTSVATTATTTPTRATPPPPSLATSAPHHSSTKVGTRIRSLFGFKGEHGSAKKKGGQADGSSSSSLTPVHSTVASTQASHGGGGSARNASGIGGGGGSGQTEGLGPLQRNLTRLRTEQHILPVPGEHPNASTNNPLGEGGDGSSALQSRENSSYCGRPPLLCPAPVVFGAHPKSTIHQHAPPAPPATSAPQLAASAVAGGQCSKDLQPQDLQAPSQQQQQQAQPYNSSQLLLLPSAAAAASATAGEPGHARCDTSSVEQDAVPTLHADGIPAGLPRGSVSYPAAPAAAPQGVMNIGVVEGDAAQAGGAQGARGEVYSDDCQVQNGCVRSSGGSANACNSDNGGGGKQGEGGGRGAGGERGGGKKRTDRRTSSSWGSESQEHPHQGVRGENKAVVCGTVTAAAPPPALGVVGGSEEGVPQQQRRALPAPLDCSDTGGADLPFESGACVVLYNLYRSYVICALLFYFPPAVLKGCNLQSNWIKANCCIPVHAALPYPEKF